MNEYGYKECIYRWIVAWPALVDNIVIILSFGTLYPDLAMKFLNWRTGRNLDDYSKNG